MRDCGHDGPWEAPSVLVSSVASFCSAPVAAPSGRGPATSLNPVPG